MIAGPEANPGPMEHGSDSYHSDEVPGVVKAEEKSAEGGEAESKKIKISKLPANINKEILLMFFENKIKCDGKVVDVTLNTNDFYAIVEFDQSAAVYEVMEQRPLTIYGFEVDIDTLDMTPQDIPRIRISGLMENTNKEMLAMYFECEERNGGGKVKNIEIDQKGKLATIDFVEKAGADAFMRRNPKRILGMDVTVEVIEDKDDAKIEYDGRKMQGAESTQTTGTTFDARAETEPDPSHTNESKLKDATMSDGGRVWKWKKKLWKYFDKPEASEQSIDKYKNELDKNGLTGLKDLLSKDLESWKSTVVHIAVTGASGAGKSSFINSIRGLTPEDTGAAEVGVNETTLTCTRYEHPRNKSFVVSDLPGVGTPNFPQETYLKKICFDQYDFFIIISKDRFTELDLWLAQEIREQKKSCFFVRSNIDVTIGNNARDFRKTHNEANLLQTIQNKISKEFQSKGVSDQKIFLISNCEWNKYDFGKLNNELLSLSDGLQKETLALSLSAVTREIMEEKEKVLTGRIPKIALSIASAKRSEQKELFKKEINFYRKQFNIDEETLSENRDILFLTDDHMEDFQVVFDEHKQKSGMTMETPTASVRDVPTLMRILDSFTWSKQETLLYIFSEKALKINLELLHKMAKTFYDAAKFNNLVKKSST